MLSLLKGRKVRITNAFLAGAGFFILSVVLRFLSVSQTQHPTGWDGYYYVMQVHSWMTFGHMQSPDFSLIYLFLTITTFITGDPIIGFRVGVALIAGLLVIAVYYLVRNPVACSYIVFSPLITYFILQFPKNALGLVFFIFFMSSLKRPGIVTVILFVCTILTHRMTGAFALMAIGFYAFRYISWKWIVGGIVLVIAVGFLPGIIHISDLSRFEGEFVWIPHWAPLAFTKIFPTSLDWLFKADLVLVTIMTIASIALVAINYKQLPLDTWIWFLLVVISMFPFFTFAPGHIGHRFLMIAPIALVTLISLIVKPVRVASIALACVFVAASFFSYRSYVPWAFDAPNEVYRTMVERLVKRYNPAEYPLVIAHKGLAEIIIYKTDFDALNWLPPVDIPSNHLLRITRHVRGSDFKKYLGEDKMRQVKPISIGYFTLPEDTWQEFVAAARVDNDPGIMRRIFAGDNPMKQRPYFIEKGKKH